MADAVHESVTPQTADLAPFPLALRLAHWTVAVLLLAVFALAWALDRVGAGPLGAALVNAHRSLGLTLLAVMTLRLAWRLTRRLPLLPASVAPWERRLAGTVQALLYAALLAQPLVGWAASLLAGDRVRLFGIALPDWLAMDEEGGEALFAWHERIAWVILALVALHVAGALRHRFVKRDGVFQRISLAGGRRG